MYCTKCGAQNADGSNFCSSCGAAIVHTEIQNELPDEKITYPPQEQNTEAQQSVSNATQSILAETAHQELSPSAQQSSAEPVSQTIPSTNGGWEDPKKLRCPKCKSERLISTTDTIVNDNSKGYGGGLGCLGFLLMGPLGLLCGLCGKKRDISVENLHYFICQDCGHEFLAHDDAVRMLNSIIYKCYFGGISTVAIAFTLICVCIGEGIGGLLPFLAVIALIIGIIIVVQGRKLGKKLHELEEHGYEASYYNDTK